jgi:hypothetical protein
LNFDNKWKKLTNEILKKTEPTTLKNWDLFF